MHSFSSHLYARILPAKRLPILHLQLHVSGLDSGILTVVLQGKNQQQQQQPNWNSRLPLSSQYFDRNSNKSLLPLKSGMPRGIMPSLLDTLNTT